MSEVGVIGVGDWNRSWKTVTNTEGYDNTGLVIAEYAEDVAAIGSESETADALPIELDLTPATQKLIVPGTWKFEVAGDRFIDRNGDLYRDVDSNGSGLLAGTIDYTNGVATLNDYPGGSPDVSILTGLLQRGRWTVSEIMFRTPGSPIKAGSLYIQASEPDGTLIEATGNLDGGISSDKVKGDIDYTSGWARLFFGEFVDDSSLSSAEKNEAWYSSDNVKGDGTIWRPREVLPTTASFNAVVLSSLPLDADLLGLNPVRLPSDGRVPIFQEAGVVVLHNTQSETMPSPLSAGQSVTLSRSDLALVRLEDDTGAEVDQAQYSVDLAAGEVTMADPLDLSGYTEPLVAFHRIEQMLLVTDVQIDGRINISGGVDRDYPAGSKCSSALIYGDLQSRVTDYFEQESWDGATWEDSATQPDTTASYNLTQYPIQVTNRGAIRERWALDFTSSTTFDVIGETVGVIAQGDTSTDLAPTNPETGVPYFTMLAAGFGTGWQVGNLIRFNTEAAAAPLWAIRTILPGPAQNPNDSFQVQNRGDAE